VLGDQSSGKSSVLESLSGFSFPQAPGLCTRYAIQISCRREPEERVTVSIIPREGAVDAATEKRLRAFKRDISKLSNEVFLQIIQDANEVMRIRKTADDTDSSLCTFSNDTLKIEICGPEQEHLTIIDVPGIFRVSSPPFTTNDDMDLVRKMVQSYLENSQTIILAVLPSNVDIATQEILEMAERADPEGARTIGVLTKPDLVTEAASQKVIEDLLLGKEKQLQLGYYVVKNRSADDEETTVSDRLAQENAFFEQLTWREIAASGRCGIEPLKNRLSELITDIWRKRLPNVKSRVTDGSTGGHTRQRVSELLGADKINLFHPWEEQRHPWSSNKSQDLDCPTSPNLGFYVRKSAGREWLHAGEITLSVS
jgi:GTPase SAR1 family protein